jgi:hypothetical protein
VAFFFWQCSGWANSQQTRNAIRVCMLLGWGTSYKQEII